MEIDLDDTRYEYTDADGHVWTLREFLAAMRARHESRSDEAMLARLLKTGMSRESQLARYTSKRKIPDATFRAYAPLKLDEKARGDVKRAASAAGVATERDLRPNQCPARDGRGLRCTRRRNHEQFTGQQEHKF